MRVAVADGLCLLAMPGTAQVVNERSIGAGVAVEAAVAAVEACTRRNVRVTAAVVDRGGTLKALVRGDGAGPHTTSTAERKASAPPAAVVAALDAFGGPGSLSR